MKALKWLMLLPMLAWGQQYYNQTQEPPDTYFYVKGYGAKCDGTTDDSTAINAAITAAAVSGGVVILPSGSICVHASSINLLNSVTISGYGATLKYSGSGYALSTAATGTTNFPIISGLTINLTSASAGALHLSSVYKGTFRDITINGTSVGTTNIAILMDTNTTGTTNPAGNLNTAMNYLVNISLDTQAGTGIQLNGTDSGHVVTDNTIANFKTMLGSVAVAGIDFNQWADSNDVTGMTRIKLTTASPANGACLVFGDGAGGGIYSEIIGHIACDVFSSPATDNRTGMIANNTVVKQCVIEQLQYGPITTNYGAYDTTGVKIVAADWLSSVVNVASTNANNQTTSYNHDNLVLAPDAGVPLIISGNANLDLIQANVGANSNVINALAATGQKAQILLRGNGITSASGLAVYQDGTNVDFIRSVGGLVLWDGTNTTTGGAKGGGTLNTRGVYVNGSSVVSVICDSASAAGTTHTGDTAETNIAVCTVPANAMASKGTLRITALALRSATTTNTVTYRIRFATTSGAVSGGVLPINLTNATSGVVNLQIQTTVQNTATNAQLIAGDVATNNPYAIGTTAVATGSIDTTAASYVNFNCVDTTSSADTCGYYWWQVELINP